MSLSLNEHLKRLVPSWLYYPHKIAKCVRIGEPELRILRDLVPAHRVALDVGANRGYYSYALSKIARRVEAFEPHPQLARFIRSKLGPSVPVHEVALSNRCGRTMLYVPQVKGNVDVHYNSSLKKVYPFSTYVELSVEMKTLDAFGFDDIGFIKIDVEGADMDVIEGAQATIAASRPNMVVELIGPTHADSLANVEQVKRMFDYEARIMVGDHLLDAVAVLRDGSAALNTFNVVFTPK